MKHAIVTYYQEKYKEILPLAVPRLKKYATKCKADFIDIFFDDNVANPQMEKFFHIGKELEGYDSYLVIDIDILVRKDSPNIFEIIDPNKLAAYNEGSTFYNTYGIKHDEIQARFQNIWDITNECKLPKIDLHYDFNSSKPFLYFNSGVVVIPKKYLYLYSLYQDYKECLYKSKIMCSEQALVNHFIYWKKPDLYHLPQCFNQMNYNRMLDYLNVAYFSHYAGVSLKQKTDEMFVDDKKWKLWHL